jgi:hypothetical protein
MMVGRPLPGLAAEDILRGIDVLESQGLAGAGCTGYARGLAGVALLHAAALDGRIAEVIIEGGLLSWESVARTPVHRRTMAGLVPGVLGVYDLPDLAAAIAPRPLTLVNARGPAGDTLQTRQVREAYSYAASAYTAEGAAGNFTIGLRREAEPVEICYRAFGR